jgi:hypothetical protein
MPKFIIYSKLDTRESGGLKALYGLATTLRGLGEDAYIAPWDLSIPPLIESKLLINGIPAASPNIIDLENDIIIYPEIIAGNPLGARNIVRWILCTPGKISSDNTASWGEQDLRMYWSDFTSNSSQALGEDDIMYILELEERWLGGEPQESRTESYFLTRKARHFHQSVQRLHPEDAIHLDTVCRNTNDYLARYKRGKLLVCYDPYSFHATLSALAGCLAVVYPLPGVSREEWVRQGPGYHHLPTVNGSPFMPGIAYGAEDLNLARQTSHLLWPVLQQLSAAGTQSVQRFIDRSKAYFQ